MNNQITLVGYVGQTPHSVLFPDTGNRVAKFSIGVKIFSSKTEEDETMWLDVDAWNGLAERVLRIMTKGREVVLNGRLALSEYEQEINGVNVKMTKPVVLLTSFHLCGKKPESVSETTPAPAALKPPLKRARA